MALAALLVALPGQVGAEAGREPTRAELEERIRRLEQIIHEHGLDRPPEAKPAAPAAPPAPAAAPTPPAPPEREQVEQIVDEKLKKERVLAGWKDGFYLESPDGSYKLKLRGYLQVQGRFPFGADTDPTNSTFFLRRVRPLFEGTLYKWFDFKIMPDLGQGDVTIEDAYLDVTYLAPELKLRAGKTKVPLSLERLQSSEYITFVERSIANRLTPNRDVGFYLFGDLLASEITYQLGAFDGTLDNSSTDGDINDGKEMAARVFLHPFLGLGAPSLKGFGVGFGATYGNDDDGEDLSSLRYRTAERVTFFTYTSSSDITPSATGSRTRLAPQGYYFWGPFALMGEYNWTREGVSQENTATGAVREAFFENAGWEVQASYVLTGENASYRGVVPKRSFDPRSGRWGAFEVAARGSKIDFDGDVFALGFADPTVSAGGAAEVSAGVNWYLTRNFKLMVDYFHTRFDHDIEIDDELFSGVNSVLMQLQISY
jgi:phosphate-selective porin OprO/OprP